MIKNGFENLNKFLKTAIKRTYPNVIIAETENQTTYTVLLSHPGTNNWVRISFKDYISSVETYKAFVETQYKEFNDVIVNHFKIYDGKIRFLIKDDPLRTYSNLDQLVSQIKNNLFVNDLRNYAKTSFNSQSIIEDYNEHFPVMRLIVTRSKNILKLESKKIITNIKFDIEKRILTYSISEVLIPYFIISYRKQYPEIFFPQLTSNLRKRITNIYPSTIRENTRYISLENKFNKNENLVKNVQKISHFIGQLIYDFNLYDESLISNIASGVYGEHFINFIIKSVYNITIAQVPMLNLLFSLGMTRRQIHYYLDMDDVDSMLSDYFGEYITKFDNLGNKESLVLFLFINRAVKGSFSQLKTLVEYYKANMIEGDGRRLLKPANLQDIYSTIVINNKYLNAAILTMLTNDLIFKDIAFNELYFYKLRDYISKCLRDHILIDFTTNIFEKLKIEEETPFVEDDEVATLTPTNPISRLRQHYTAIASEEDIRQAVRRFQTTTASRFNPFEPNIGISGDEAPFDIEDLA